ncbi:hypothetical protein TIFTF001_020447 [Ficus carica]|uniref:Uncharacterized protein n=1 Tax=Ficus carica TaxID=3494 RepID=A0AA88DDN9_FICCA|nr:hypothetical protein TIFTF001_020447 [Ficus carica]
MAALPPPPPPPPPTGVFQACTTLNAHVKCQRIGCGSSCRSRFEKRGFDNTGSDRVVLVLAGAVVACSRVAWDCTVRQQNDEKDDKRHDAKAWAQGLVGWLSIAFGTKGGQTLATTTFGRPKVECVVGAQATL